MENEPTPSIDRREFLKMAGVTAVAGTIIACTCNLQRLVTSSSAPSVNRQQLQDQFGLTPIKARTFAVFIDHRSAHLGRRKIARQLGISLNTLKDHITAILEDMRSSSGSNLRGINDAVNMAVFTFKLKG